MLGVGGALGLLLAASAIAQEAEHVNYLNYNFNPSAHSSLFEYTPAAFPVDPSEGWNFSTTVQNGVYPYKPPLFDSHAMPYTTLAGAKMTARFYGYGASVSGLVLKDVESTISLTLDGSEHLTSRAVQRGRVEGQLVAVNAKEQENKWRTLTLTLVKGGMQLHTVNFRQLVVMNLTDVRESPWCGVNGTEFDATEISPYYRRTGQWEARKLFEPGCE